MINKLFSRSLHRSSQFLIIFNCIFLWVLFSLCRHYLDQADMVENYAWGINWMWGSNKHPQMFAWIAAAWFKLFPTQDWAYYLLTELSLLIALLFLMLSMRKTLSPQQVFIALVLTVLLAPLSIERGHKYNANIAQLPFLAGYAWALLSAIADNRKTKYFLAGLFAGSAILTKYSAVIFLASISIALWTAYRPKPAQFLSGILFTGITALALVSPHIYWSIQHHWPSFTYLHEKHLIIENSWLPIITKNLQDLSLFFIGTIPAMIVLFWSRNGYTVDATARPRTGLLIFMLGMLGTSAASWFMHVTPTANWFIPAILFFGWAIVDILPPNMEWHKAQIRLKWLVVTYYALVLAATIYAKFIYDRLPAPPEYALPETLSKDITRIYHDAYHESIHYAAGSFPLPYMLSFYSPDHPYGADALDIPQSLWIDPLKFKQQNKVIICSSEKTYFPKEPECSNQAIRLFGSPQQSVTLQYKTYDPDHKKMGAAIYHILMYHQPEPTL